MNFYSKIQEVKAVFWILWTIKIIFNLKGKNLFRIQLLSVPFLKAISCRKIWTSIAYKDATSLPTFSSSQLNSFRDQTQLVSGTELQTSTSFPTMKMFSYILLLSAMVTCKAQMISPEVNPYEPGLYLTTAGPESKIIRPLNSRETICLKDYPTGISVLCVGNSPWANFYVNNMFIRKDHLVPFYIRGNIGSRVRAWHPEPQVNWVKCRLRYKVVFKSRIYNRSC